MAADQIIGHRRGFKLPSPGANSPIFSTNILTAYPTSALRITVVLATGSVLNVTIYDGAEKVTAGLDKSVALNAGDMYTFTFGADGRYEYNFEVETTGIINYIKVDEVPTGVI